MVLLLVIVEELTVIKLESLFPADKILRIKKKLIPQFMQVERNKKDKGWNSYPANVG